MSPSRSRPWAWACLLASLVLPGLARAQIADLASGGLIGRVFYDHDGDGIWSPGDEGLAGVRILTSGGLVLISGPEGGFHAFLLESGFEVGGEHVLVVDRSTLASGARVRGGLRRLVKLHPAMLAQVDFAIGPPQLAVAMARGVDPPGDGVPAWLEPLPGGGIETRLAGKAPRGCRVAVEGEDLALDGAGVFQKTVRVDPGVNPFLLSLRCDDGHLELLLLELHWLHRRSGGDLVVPGKPRTLLVCAGPPAASLPRSKEIQLLCRPAPGVSLDLGAAEAIEGDRATDLRRFRLPVRPGENELSLQLRLGDRSPLRTRVRWQVSPVRLLAASHGQVTLGLPLGGRGTGLILAGSLRGNLLADLPEDFQLILGGGLQTIDIEGLSGSEAASRTLAPDRDPTVLERAPDPERGPVAFADGGQVRSLNPAGSRYFLGVRRKSSWAGWGSFSTDGPADDQPGQVRRALHGAHLDLRPLEDWFPGDEPALDLRLAGFYAQALERRPLDGPGSAWEGPALQLPAHEEFTSTGGTLFFLSHPWLVEGSLRLVAEQRDRLSGAVVERMVLRPGLDVAVDWLSGRLLLNQPLPGFVLTSGAVRMHPLGSLVTVLVADYEYLSSGAGQGPEEMLGGSVALSGRPTQDLQLRGSLSTMQSLEAAPGASYDLLRSRVEARYADWARVWAAWAQSRGQLLVPAFSQDGGLSFEALIPPDRQAGESWEAGVALGADRVSGRATFRRQLNGFSDSLRLVGRDLNQILLQAGARPVDELGITAAFTGNEFQNSRLIDGRFGLGWRVWKPLLIEVEGGFQGGFGDEDDAAVAAWTQGGSRALVGLRAAWDASDWLTLLAGHQHTVYRSGEGWTSRDLTLTSAGGRLRISDGMELQAEAGWGPEVGTVLRLGASRADETGAATFAHSTFSVDGSAFREGSYTAGQSAPVGGGCLLSSSQTLGQFAGGDAIGQRIALDAPIHPRWRLHLAYERAELHQAGRVEDRKSLFFNPFIDRSVVFGGGPGRRNAVFTRLAYLGQSLQLSASGEYRVDQQWPLAFGGAPGTPAPTEHRQTVATVAGRYRPHPELALAGRLAWAETFGRAADGEGPGWPEGGMFEGSASLMYRPAVVGWLRLLIRAAAGTDHRPPRTEIWPARNGGGQWALASLATVLTPSRFIQPTLVIAPWWRVFPDPGGAGNLRKFQMLGALRLGSELWAGLGLAGELRLSMLERNYGLTPVEGDEGARAGGAAEVFYQLESDEIGGLRCSVGYSFSDLPDPLLTNLFAGHQGLFLRLEGMY